VLGISQSLVLLWSAYRQSEHFQTDLDESESMMEQQLSEPQLRVQPAYAMNLALTQPDRSDEPEMYAPVRTPSHLRPVSPAYNPAEQDSLWDEPGVEESPIPPSQIEETVQSAEGVEQMRALWQSLEQQASQPLSRVAQFQQPLLQQVQPLRGAVPAYEPVRQGTGPRIYRTGPQYAHLRIIPEPIEPELFEEAWEPTRPLPGDAEEENVGISQIPTVARTSWDETDDEQEATLRLVIGIGLDPGLVRKDRPNEDNLFAIQGIRTTEDGPVPAGLFVIADGMGGHANGGDASRLAVREISNVIVPTLLRDDSANSSEEQDEQEYLLNLLEGGVQRANQAIYEQNLNMPDMMGTTITTALVVNTTAYIVNVGDSRTYLYRAADGLVPITRDHSTVARLVEEGEIKPEEIYTHPQRNQIYRCLGEYSSVELDTFVVPLEPDDILLLCSDGLWEMVRDPVMEKIITSSSHLPAQISNILVQAALSEGGADNISVVVVGIVKTV